MGSHWLAPVVATGGAAFGAAAGLVLPHPYQIVSSALLAAIMAAIALEDFRRLRVPDLLNVAAALAGLVTIWLAARAESTGALGALGHALLSALLCGGALLLVREAFFRLRRVDGLGLGDVKLAATAGIWLGWELFAVSVTLAALSALVFVVGEVVRSGGPSPHGKRIPFASFLAPAIWVTWYLGRLLMLE